MASLERQSSEGSSIALTDDISSEIVPVSEDDEEEDPINVEDSNPGFIVDDTTTTSSNDDNTNNNIVSDVTFRKSLNAGFRSLLGRQPNQLMQHQPKGLLSFPFLNEIVIDFIDPSSSTSFTTPPPTPVISPKPPIQKGHQHQQPPPPPPPADCYYDKFVRILERDYNSRIQYIPIQNFRSGSKGVAEHVKLKTIRSEGGVLLNESISNISESGGGSKSSSSRLSSQDWHVLPYCYIYFADCEHLEHYRTKVKPSIQAFVSQLESTIESMSASSSTGTSTSPNTSSNIATDTSTNSTTSGGTTSSTTNPASSSNSNNNNGSNHCPPYVIIFIPTGSNEKAGNRYDGESPPKGARGFAATAVGATIGNRFAAARRLVAGSSSADATTTTATLNSSFTINASSGTPATNTSTMSSTTAGGDDIPDSSMQAIDVSRRSSSTSGPRGSDFNDSLVVVGGSEYAGGTQGAAVAAAAVGIQSPIHRLSRLERELLRRLTIDFPNGNVCTLSTLTWNDQEMNEDGYDMSFQRSEWNVVLKCIGSAIAEGFKFRCQRYDEELRRLDHTMRLSTAIGPISPKNDQQKQLLLRQQQQLHQWNYFFLVKESLAFTHEQMNLYQEALLQYQELHAFLPDNSMDIDEVGQITTLIDDLESNLRPRNKQEHGMEDISSLSLHALTGNVIEFRSRLRLKEGDKDYVRIAPECVEEYLLGRETALLFKMNQPITILERCISFVKNVYQQKKLKAAGKSTTPTPEQQQQLLTIQKWALEFCWDVKEASSVFLVSSKEVGAAAAINQQKQFTRQLCTLMEFACHCMKDAGRLAKYFVDEVDGLSSNEDEYHKSLLGGIGDSFKNPWTEHHGDNVARNGEIVAILSSHMSGQELVKTAFASIDSFQKCFAGLIHYIIALNTVCGKYRYAARFRIMLMDTYLMMSDKASATEQLRSIVDLYGKDRWHYSYFALIFRLASLEREVAAPIQYLRTLVRTFTEYTFITAPIAALTILHNDILQVVQSKSVAGCRYESAPLFYPVLGLEGLALPPAGSERALLKKVFTVGDTVNVTLELTSFLPNEIEVDEISVVLVPFRIYVAAMEDQIPLKEEDVFRVLSLKALTPIKPRDNKFMLHWKPVASGQFILSELSIVWKEVTFTYTAKALYRRPTIRIDVVPSEPTQRLDVRPKFLIPGHEQPLDFSFSAGMDNVKEGTLHLASTPGLLFLSQDDNSSWVPTYKTHIPSCLPGQTVTITTRVKSAPLNASSVVHDPLLVQVATFYKISDDDSGDDSLGIIDTSLEIKVPTMDRHVLSIHECDLAQYSTDRFLLSVTILCNAPAPFKVKRWDITLPTKLVLSEVGDMNESLVDVSMEYGERINLCFDCSYCYDVDETSKTGVYEAMLRVDMENEYGTLFKESMKLNLTRFLAGPTALNKPTEVDSIPVKIIPSVTEGMVGVPVEFTASIDCCKIPNAFGKVIYKIISVDGDWIISGLIEGTIVLPEQPTQGDNYNHSVVFVGIPSRPGKLVNYPSVRLVCQQRTTTASVKCATKTIVVTNTNTNEQQQVYFFNALSPSSHTTIASPLIIVAGTNKHK